MGDDVILDEEPHEDGAIAKVTEINDQANISEVNEQAISDRRFARSQRTDRRRDFRCQRTGRRRPGGRPARGEGIYAHDEISFELRIAFFFAVYLRNNHLILTEYHRLFMPSLLDSLLALFPSLSR